MNVIRPNINDVDYKPCVATIGFFDGVHKGHRFLIRQVERYSRERSLPAALITFTKPPRQVVQHGYKPELLTTLDEKIGLLSDTGVDECLLLEFTKEMAQLSARDFMAHILKGKFHVEVLVIGYDHRFGHNRSEGFQEYLNYGRELGITVVHAPQYLYKGEKVSSSAIRTLLRQGNIMRATEMLGCRYRLTGTVVKGFQVGRTINFPTANMLPDDSCKLVPERGVYAVWVLLDGKRYMGMLNIGTRPTVNKGANCTIETHILHFSQDIYGHQFTIEFVARLRSEQKFDSLRSLQEQLEKDKIDCEHILSKYDAVP